MGIKRKIARAQNCGRIALNEMSNCLSREGILEFLRRDPSLIEGYLDLDEQLQPNGFDLTLREVSMLQSTGRIGTKKELSIVSEKAPLIFEPSGFLYLIPGTYLVIFNEVVRLPANLTALGLPRSSLLRSGVAIHTAVWDAGYSGRSQALMVIYNERGFEVQQNARILQLIFLHLDRNTKGYQGSYQGENI